jgi:hypothetical protein
MASHMSWLSRLTVSGYTYVRIATHGWCSPQAPDSRTSTSTGRNPDQYVPCAADHWRPDTARALCDTVKCNGTKVKVKVKVLESRARGSLP